MTLAHGEDEAAGVEVEVVVVVVWSDSESGELGIVLRFLGSSEEVKAFLLRY